MHDVENESYDTQRLHIMHDKKQRYLLHRSMPPYASFPAKITAQSIATAPLSAKLESLEIFAADVLL